MLVGEPLIQIRQQHKLTISGDKFLLDGKPFQIISGEMHYPRIPREYWHARLKMARAMGLNTISTYVFWNLHEPKPGVYDFSGQLDVAEFIREAQEEGLHVILRPGPYVCAEWDLGGLPSWLLADPQIVLRSDDPKFMQPVERWLKRLGQELAPLQATRGGPIFAVQVENEYGSFDNDKHYLKHIYDLIVAAGFGESLLYTADGPEQLPNGTLPGVPAVVNFGPGETKEAFAALAKFRPGQPLMAGEYWAGWFDHWGGKHAATEYRRAGARSQVDAGARILREPLHVSRRHDIRLHERRQLRRAAMSRRRPAMTTMRRWMSRGVRRRSITSFAR